MASAEVRRFHMEVVVNQGLDCLIIARKLIKEPAVTEKVEGSNAPVGEGNPTFECKWGRVGTETCFHVWQPCDDTEMRTSATAIHCEKGIKDIIVNRRSPEWRQLPEYDLLVSMFGNQVRDSRCMTCTVLKRMLPRAAIPKGISLDGTSLLIRMHMKMYGGPPYNPVNMFIMILTRDHEPDKGPHDFIFHLANIFIQNLFNCSRPLVMIYTVAKTFIEQLHDSTLQWCLLDGIVGMFLKELFKSNLGHDFIFNMSVIFIEKLLGYTLSSTSRLHDTGVATIFVEELFEATLGRYLTLEITWTFIDYLYKADLPDYRVSELTGKLIQGAFKSTHDKKMSLKVITIAAKRLYSVPRKLATYLPGLHPLLNGNLQDDLILKGANKYVNIFMAHPDKEVIKDCAWTFHYECLCSEKLLGDLKTKLAMRFIKRYLNTRTFHKDTVKQIFNSFIFMLEGDNLAEDDIFDILQALICHVFGSDLPDEVTKDIAFTFALSLPKHKAAVSYDLAAMFTKALFEARLTEELSLWIVDNLTLYAVCDGRVEEDIAFDIAAMFIGHLHESSLSQELKAKFASILIRNLNRNILPEGLTFDIASMFVTYLAKAQFSTEVINELKDDAEQGRYSVLS